MDYSLNEEAKIGEKRGGTNTHKAECLLPPYVCQLFTTVSNLLHSRKPIASQL